VAHAIRPQTPGRRVVLWGALLAAGIGVPLPAMAASARELTDRSQAALAELYAANGKAKALGASARAVLVFPQILKAGLVVGGQGGEGAMLRGGRPAAFYKISAASYGLQIGAQKYGYALFFMTENALQYLEKSKGWSVGTGISVVMVDDGYAKPMTSTTLTQDVYAVAFQQKGLMAGTGLEGARIKQIYPEP
jgi:lipid-binding SYLF domain-containing protein